ncbi:MAG: hypothetical protein R3C03_21225 [Pirellulaceae bacterium]
MAQVPLAPAQQQTAKTTEKANAPLTEIQIEFVKARRAMAQGDVVAAKAIVDKLRASGQDFSSMSDSPEAIEQLIARQQELTTMQANGSPVDYNLGAADFLLQQCDALIGYHDVDAAMFLLDQAESFPVDFSKTKFAPAALRERLDGLKSANTQSPALAKVAKLMAQAQLAVDSGNWSEADRLVREAKGYNLPDSAFAADAVRPWQLELQVAKALKQQGLVPPIQLASSSARKGEGVQTADYDPSQDSTHNAVVSHSEPDMPNRVGSGVSGKNNGHAMDLYRSGLAAMDNDDPMQAKEYFEMAMSFKDQLDSGTQQAIQDKLVKMASATMTDAQEEEIDLTNLKADEQMLFKSVQKDVLATRADADKLMHSDPREALDRMISLRTMVSNSELSNASMAPLLTIIDRDINEMQKFIQANLPEIINEEENSSRMEAVELSRERRYEVEQRLQQLTEEFNQLVDQQRFAEAEIIARQAVDLDPNSEITALLIEKAKFMKNVGEGKMLNEIRTDIQGIEFGQNMEIAATPMDTSRPYQMGDADEWDQRTRMRLEQMQARQYRNEAERRIYNTLKDQMIQGEFRGSLAEAMQQLAVQSGINITFDDLALRAESVEASTTTISQDFANPISMKSAMNVLLGSVGLTYVVEDEVIKVTSRDAQSKRLEQKTYYVGDLVSPVVPPSAPNQMNFITPYQDMNTQNALLAQNSNMMNVNQMAQNQMSPVALAQQLPGGQGLFGGNMNPLAMGALSNAYGGGSGGPQRGTPTYTSQGVPALGGITLADFNPLINLIQTTIAPDDWTTTQGEGSIQPYLPNLTLVVAQTQEVHDEIQDLLNQLRKLNDVQIVVEVRFITLGDNFFERIGVDFDFAINDGNSALTPAQVLTNDVISPNTIVGRDPTVDQFVPTQDLDLEFSQNSIGSTIPTFGGFDPGTAANFGFAILSDIEVFFLIQASKGDQRTNLTQAPTVTMFNGQSASVQDQLFQPFVTSVVPVVGDFAVAQQPIITIIPEGASLNVSATVSGDRRFVKLSLVPYFSEIVDVKTFTFEGSRTTRQTNSSFLQDLLDQVSGTDSGDNAEDIETVSTGTTVQQPVVATTSVSTVVSVPDGGTVLMGGIKRLRERRIERGVPFLSNIPYVNRLFKNVGIGRETSNLMMMVTPRIIIQEEEERRQVGPIGGN